ncbi:MAG: HlyD family secretion protein [Flavobacteriales bacterium]|jgi:HlyD family secretion protein
MQTLLEATSAPHLSRKRKRVVVLAILVLVVINVWGLTTVLKPTASVSYHEIRAVHVLKANLIKDVRAPGNLVPIKRLWISAQVNARVVERILEPGAKVDKETLIARLESPELRQRHLKARVAFKVSQTALAALREQQLTELHQQESEVILLAIEIKQAEQDKHAKQVLIEKHIIPQAQYNESILRLERLQRRTEIETFKLDHMPNLHRNLFLAEEAKVEQIELEADLLAEKVESLNVRAGMPGILQSMDIEVGQEILSGSEIARVASQDQLKVELRVQERQIKDVAIGQNVIIDTRRSKINGHVSRVDPAVINGTVTVDVFIDDRLPSEARPDLRVDGIIEIDRASNTLVIDKPEQWHPNHDLDLYVFGPKHTAHRKTVRFGKHSTSKVQILSGLSAGDIVIISDLSRFYPTKEIKLTK